MKGYLFSIRPLVPVSLFLFSRYLSQLLYCALFGEREGKKPVLQEKVVHRSCTHCCHDTAETDPCISSSFSAIRKILFDFCSSGACVLTASHLSIAILDRVQHQIAAGLACGNKNDAGVPEGGRALL